MVAYLFVFRFNLIIMSKIDLNEIINPKVTKFPRFKPKLKIAILASGKGTNFETIINDINNDILDAEITCLIVNNNKCGAIDKARKNNIPYFIFNHQNYLNREELDHSIIDKLHEYNSEVIVMVGWMRIVTKVLLDEFKSTIIFFCIFILINITQFNSLICGALSIENNNIFILLKAFIATVLFFFINKLVNKYL